MTRAVRVLDPGPSTTVQDPGRPGLAHLGVPRSGWLDRPAAEAGNRLVGNAEGLASLECVLGGLRLRVLAAVTGAVTGAPCPVRVGGRAAAHGAALSLRAGEVLSLGRPPSGLRSYVALAGGVDAVEVLGSRSTDTLSGLGPPRVAAGDVLPLGERQGDPSGVELVRAATAPGEEVLLRLLPGPRADRFRDALTTLGRAAYTVQGDSDRVGLRLAGTPLVRRSADELPSEGLVLGAVQVPADGQPLVFLADHPTTGGYPVVAVVDARDLPRCAQLRPGDAVRLRPVTPPR